jgi:hypothetical protein
MCEVSQRHIFSLHSVTARALQILHAFLFSTVVEGRKFSMVALQENKAR